MAWLDDLLEDAPGERENRKRLERLRILRKGPGAAPEIPIPEVDVAPEGPYFEMMRGPGPMGPPAELAGGGPEQAPGRPQALPQAMARTQTPPGGQNAPVGPSRPPGGAAVGPPAPATAGAVDPLQERVNARQKDLEAALAAQDALLQPPDRTAMEAAYKKRAATGEHQLVLSLMAKRAGLDPAAAYHLKQSSEAVEPMKMAGGTMTETGFIEDPAYAQELKLRRADGRLKQIQSALDSAVSAQERERLKKMELDARKDLQDAMIASQQFIAGQASADRRYAADLSHADRAAKGAGGKTPADPQHILNLVGEAKRVLPKATGSGFGRHLDQVAGYFGVGTEGADAGGKLDAIGGQLVMAQPRMEGPQSDADRQLYERMAGDVANASKPISVRLAALDQIQRMAENYRSGYWAPPGYKPPATQAAGGRRATDQGGGRVVNYSDLK